MEEDDIRETGPVGIKGLKGLNQQQAEEPSFSPDHYINLSNAYAKGSTGPVYTDLSTINEYDSSSPMGNWGKSSYDEGILNAPMTSGQIQDTRYENQSSLDVLANGVAKMLGTAATTFVSSLVGLPYGAIEAARQGRWSAIWDNKVTQTLSDVDEWMDNNAINYQSEEQKQEKWYQRVNDLNWWADNVIKNVGFQLGAAASAAMGSGALGLLGRATGLVNNVSKGTRLTNNVLSSLFSATGEGMIEARQGVEERNKRENKRLEDALAPEYAALDEEENLATQEYNLTGDYQTYSNRLRDIIAQREVLDQRKQAGQQQITESGQEMGNKILLGNQILLTAGNLIQFSKLMNAGFDNARHAAETVAKDAKPFLVGAKRVGENLSSGYRVYGKTLGRINAGAKGLVTEGSEEMNQQWIQNTAGYSSNEGEDEAVNDYWRAKLDPEAYRNTTDGLYTLGSAISRGFKDSWGDFDQWEQFVVGGITGMAGSYAPTKILNQDKSKSAFNPMRYGEWGGGAYNELKEFNRQYNQYEENINDLNTILADGDFEARILDSVGHTFMEGEKEQAAAAGDKKAWKDADDKQNIMDIQAFLRAGKLDDLRTIYSEMGKDLSDEDIEEMVRRNSPFVTQEEDKQNHFAEWDARIAAAETPEEKAKLEAAKAADSDYEGKSHYTGNFVDEDGNWKYTTDEIRDKIKKNTEEYQRKLNSYLDSIQAVQTDTGGQLTKDQEDNLAYLHFMGRESNYRMQDIMANRRKDLPQKFLIKTNNTPEELTREFATSDLVFSKDENTKEGYVEADTSLMTAPAFARFFQEYVVKGKNINPEFAETAEEKAIREEEDKNLSEEERKKKNLERLSKKWEEANEKQEKDVIEQRGENAVNIENFFRSNYRKNNPTASETDVDTALDEFWKDILDAGKLYNQAGSYNATLRDYMKNPTKVDKDKTKEATKTAEKKQEQQTKDKFAGKTAKDINQEIAAGTMNATDVDDFAGISADALSDVSLQAAQEEAKKSKEIRQKAASLNNHIMESLGDNPTPEELSSANMAMQMVNSMASAANDPEEISMDNINVSSLPIDAVDPNITADSIDIQLADAQEKIAGAFNALQEDEIAQDDIPDQSSVEGVSLSEVQETGDDPVTKVAADTAAPRVTPIQNKPVVAPVNSLSEEALDKVITETYKVTETAPDSAFRIATRRFGRTKTADGWRTTDKPYHELVKDKDSLLYKRSKAIWEYLNSENAFERTENSSADRINNGDTIHFMVRYMPEVFDSSFDDVSDENKPYSLAIIMLNDNNEVLGDLPLAQFEPSYRSGNPSQQVKDLMAFQEKAFNAFMENYGKEGETEYRLDDSFSSTVKQVMRGDVPYSRTERNTLNDVAGESNLQIGVRLYDGRLATKKGEERTVNKDIVVPDTGNPGQPYMLLPMPTGERIAVPFYTVPFTMEQHNDTDFHKMLRGAVFYLLKSDTFVSDKKKQNEYFSKHLNALKGLLQVDSIEGKRVLERKNGNIILNLRSLTDPDTEYTVSVPDTGNARDDARALVAGMDGIPINVSLDYLNDNIEVGIAESEKYNRGYNRLIGDIANVNLPKNTTHTVNGWFTANIPSTYSTSNTQAEAQPVQEAQPSVERPQALQENSMEDIDKTAKDAGILSRKTADAWRAIPNDLKIKMVREGAFITLSYGTGKVTTSWGDMRLRDILEAVNQSAKIGNLTASEAAKHMESNEIVITKEDERAARQWLSKNLPSLSSEERTQFVDKLSGVVAEDQVKVWGTYKNGVIQIQRNAPIGTVYHEAFHYVVDMILSEEEKQQILGLAKNEYGNNLTDYEAEERLANDFRRYSIDENAEGISGKIKRWFRKIWDRITRYNRISDATVNQLFWKINNGELASRAAENENFDKTQQTVLQEIRRVQNEKYAWKNLDNETKRNLKEYSGISEDRYNQLSLEEKEQYVKCRG